MEKTSDRAEIERLKFLNKEEQKTIDELLKLLARAADALEKGNYIDGHSVRNLHVYSFIDELRKAAE